MKFKWRKSILVIEPARVYKNRAKIKTLNFKKTISQINKANGTKKK
jgi:hypothetical protein